MALCVRTFPILLRLFVVGVALCVTVGDPPKSFADVTCMLRNRVLHPGPCTCDDRGDCPRQQRTRPYIPSPTPEEISGIHVRHGYNLLKEGKRDEAIEEFRKAIEAHPNNSEAQANYYGELAAKYLDEDHLDQASVNASRAEAYDQRYSSLRKKIDRAIEQRKHDEESAVARNRREKDSFSRYQQQAREAVIERERDNNIKSVCNSIDREVGRIADLGMNVVMLELGAVVHLQDAELPAAVRTDPNKFAETPPEEVRDELLDHLQRIATLNDRLNELNGKQAWTEEQRKWVLNHVYVAEPNGNFTVNGSEATAPGQTDFSSLQKMPAFVGCN